MSPRVPQKRQAHQSKHSESDGASGRARRADASIESDCLTVSMCPCAGCLSEFLRPTARDEPEDRIEGTARHSAPDSDHQDPLNRIHIIRRCRGAGLCGKLAAARRLPAKSRLLGALTALPEPLVTFVRSFVCPLVLGQRRNPKIANTHPNPTSSISNADRYDRSR
jgi:hypothetical protein